MRLADHDETDGSLRTELRIVSRDELTALVELASQFTGDHCWRCRPKPVVFAHRCCGRCHSAWAHCTARWELLGISQRRNADEALVDSRAALLSRDAEPVLLAEFVAARQAVLVQIWRRDLLRVVHRCRR